MMTPEDDSRIDAVTELMLETFRLNGRLLAAGDTLVGPIELTSARWQVMGALALAAQPLTVAEIARRMGLTRQSVQRTVDLMLEQGLVDLVENPRHRRAKCVRLTAQGERRYAEAIARHRPWAAGLSAGLDQGEIRLATELLRRLRERLEEDN